MRFILATVVFCAMLNQCLSIAVVVPGLRAVVVPAVVPSVVGPIVEPVVRVVPVARIVPLPLVRPALVRPILGARPLARVLIKRDMENEVNQTEPICNLTRNLLECQGLEHNFVCEVTPRLDKLPQISLNLTGLIGKPKVESSEELVLLVNSETSLVDPHTEENVTFVRKEADEIAKHNLWIFSNETVTHSGFLVKDQDCYSHLLSLTKENVALRFSIDL